MPSSLSSLALPCEACHLSSPSRPCEGPHSQAGKLRRGGYPTFKATRWAGSRPSCPAPLVLPGSAVPGTQDSPGQPGSPSPSSQPAPLPGQGCVSQGLCTPGMFSVRCAWLPPGCMVAPGLRPPAGPLPPAVLGVQGRPGGPLMLHRCGSPGDPPPQHLHVCESAVLSNDILVCPSERPQGPCGAAGRWFH